MSGIESILTPLVLVALAFYAQKVLVENRWQALGGARFEKLAEIIYENLTQKEVFQRIVNSICRVTEIHEQHRSIKWSIFFRSANKNLVEASLELEYGISPIQSWKMPKTTKSMVFLRFLIYQQGPNVRVEPEYFIQRSAYTPKELGHGEEELVLTNVIERIEDDARSMAQISQFFDKNKSAKASLEAKMSSFVSRKPFGTVKVPSRVYSQLSEEQFVSALSTFVKKGGVLKEPISGRQSLFWIGEIPADTVTKGSMQSKIRFSNYSEYEADNSQLSNELDISWGFQEVPGSSALKVSCQWSGEFSPAAGDMIRFLLDSIENDLSKLGASLVFRPGAPAKASRNSQRASFASYQTQAPAKPFWPSMQDYNEALQNPDFSFSDQELKMGKAEQGNFGLPKVATGAFASVYRMSCGMKDYAVRCFNRPMKDQQERYKRTSRFICDDDLTYTVPLIYLENGIQVRGQWFPILKMDWVEGESIYTYIDSHRLDKSALKELRERFSEMMQKLRSAGIAHSDLQHGNIIIHNRDIYLVDYDGMFVPELSGFMSNERGHPNYQHPERNARHFGPYLDNFSAWIIDSALLCLLHEPELWLRFAADAESLMFKKADFENPQNSDLLNHLRNNQNPELRTRAEFLLSLLKKPVEQIPYLNESKSIPELEQKSDTRKTAALPDWMN
ncbi:MAG: hypothetical protein K2X27_04160 [Candidatus Obscuribacterales bacterium]|nr:hypothetical protein [Candidatus Obscuribacterales bacterium]